MRREKLIFSGRRESNKSMVLILELRDLLKIAFLLVQTLKQVKGDGGIEVPEALEGWSLTLVEGRDLRAGSSPNFYLLRRDLLVSRFFFFGKIFLSGRRESNKSMVLILGRWKLFLGEARPFLPLRSLFPPLGRRSLRAGSTPGIFFVTKFFYLLEFVVFVTKLIFSGRRESNPLVRLGKRA